MVVAPSPIGVLGTILGSTPIAQPGSSENDAWVNNAYNSIANGFDALSNAISGINRPKDLPPLEERAFDRYCRNGDPCGALKAATMQAIQMALLKMNNMLNDPQKMYGTAKWFTHADDLRGRINNIFAMISLGRRLGCDMTAETIATATLLVPSEPK
jgi:hypothetical protein